MSSKRRRQILMRLTSMQQLHVACEKQFLALASQELDAALLQQQQSQTEYTNVESKLDELMAKAPFCPVNYRIACTALLLAQNNFDQSASSVEAASEKEAFQRQIWFENCQKSKWLDEASHALARQLARKADDKAGIELISLSASKGSNL